MDSGTNSDSDHQSECQLIPRETISMVLPELLKKILIVIVNKWETEPYLSSSKLGMVPPNQPIVLVLMILVDKNLMSVKIFHSNIPMSTVCGSMSIMVSTLLAKKFTLLSLVKTPTKP